MANRLTKLEIDELSLVDAPANPGARVLFTKRKTEMNDSLIVTLAKRFAAGETPSVAPFVKRDFYSALDLGSALIRKAGETPAAAFSRYATQDATGRALFKSYSAAQGPDYVPPEPVATRAEPAMTPSLKQLYDHADDLRAKQPELSKAQAFARVMETPQGRALYKLYRSEVHIGAHR